MGHNLHDTDPKISELNTEILSLKEQVNTANNEGGDHQKGGRGVSGVSWQVHILFIGHSQYGQLTAVKTGLH